MWRGVVVPYTAPTGDPGEMYHQYPKGYYWRVTDADDVLVGVFVNQRYPLQFLADNEPTRTKTFLTATSPPVYEVITPLVVRELKAEVLALREHVELLARRADIQADLLGRVDHRARETATQHGVLVRTVTTLKEHIHGLREVTGDHHDDLRSHKDRLGSLARAMDQIAGRVDYWQARITVLEGPK